MLLKNPTRQGFSKRPKKFLEYDPNLRNLYVEDKNPSHSHPPVPIFIEDTALPQQHTYGEKDNFRKR